MATQFRGYTVLETLGMGGMASIFLGVQENLKRQVAIKLLDKRLALNSGFVLRFEREARSASELNHRNIITIHEFGKENGEYFIVMEYVKGADLRAVLTQVPTLPPEIVLILLEEIASGLAAAHEKDIVHRDMKPANVLLSDTGDVKITDFGLARDYSMDASRLFDSLTAGGTVLGTPSYMSPEQASGQPLDQKTDMFSLGIMAFEMLSGQKPFTGETYTLIREAIVDREPPPVILNRPRATREIEDMVRRMLAKEPSARPDMEELLQEIESCMETIDPSGTLLRHRRRFLQKFAADPARFSDRIETLAARGPLDGSLYAQVLGRGDTSRPAVPEATPEAAPDAAPDAAPEPVEPAPLEEAPAATAPSPPPPDPVPAPESAPGWEKPPPGRDRALAYTAAGFLVVALLVLAVRPGVLESLLGRAELPDVDYLPPPELVDDRMTAQVTEPVVEPEPLPLPAPAETLGVVEEPPPAPPAEPARGWVRIRTRPAGNVLVNGRVVEKGATQALARVRAGASFTLEVSHPELFASRVWTERVAPGDTLDLGTYAVGVGTLRVVTRPFAPVWVHIAGQETRKQTPLALSVASRRQLVSMEPPGWVVEKVVVSDRTGGGMPVELTPQNRDGLAGVFVDVLDGHDHKVVFHLAPDGG